MKQTILIFLITFFVLISSVVVHELTHQYKFEEINQMCFFGYDGSGIGLESAFGWVKADSYAYPGETVPIIVMVSYATIMTLILFFTFKKDLTR